MAESWHGRFFRRHLERFHRSDWPDAGSGFWDDFQRKLIRHGVREAEAHAASEAMFDDGPPPKFVSDHPEAVVTMARQLRQRDGSGNLASAPSPASAVMTRKDAEDAEWNRQAGLNWDALAEEVRAEWRRLVQEVAVYLHPDAHRARELTAVAWAYDPSSVPDWSPPAETPRSRGVRALFGQGYDPTLKKVET